MPAHRGWWQLKTSCCYANENKTTPAVAIIALILYIPSSLAQGDPDTFAPRRNAGGGNINPHEPSRSGNAGNNATRLYTAACHDKARGWCLGFFI